MEIKISLESPELVAAILALAYAIEGRGPVARSVADAVKEKQETKKGKAAEAKTKTIEVEDVFAAGTEVKVVPTFTFDDIRTKFVALNKAGKKTELVEMLQAFGVSKVSDLEPAQFGEVMARLEGM